MVHKHLAMEKPRARRAATIHWLWVSCLLLGANLSSAEVLSPYTARYSTTAMGLGMTLNRQLTVDEAGKYTLTNEGSVFVASLKERSHFSIADGHIRAQDFKYQLKGIVNRKRAVEFLKDQGKIRSLRKKQWTEHEWQPDILDRLSQQEQLRLALLGADKPPKTLSFRVIDGPRVKVRTLAFVGKKTVSVEAGNFETWQYEQVRDDDQRTSNIWVAPALNFLMIKTVHDEDGSVIDIELKDSSLLPRDTK